MFSLVILTSSQGDRYAYSGWSHPARNFSSTGYKGHAMTCCPKCGNVRSANDANPEWQCPSCGVAYCKVMESSPVNVENRTSSVNFPSVHEPTQGWLQSLFSSPVLLLLALGLAGYGYFINFGKSDTVALTTATEAKKQLEATTGVKCR
jgi:ribosomal protein L37AE/L43A